MIIDEIAAIENKEMIPPNIDLYLPYPLYIKPTIELHISN